jgi:L-lactate dehydrogenase complex protein LldF
LGVKEAGHLPNASTFCGRCESVCPMRIPLPKMMRHWREQEFSRHLSPPAARWALRLWAFAAKRPSLYRLAAGIGARLLKLGGGRAGRLRSLPFAGGWTTHRDMPAPEGGTFQQLWAERPRR